MIDIFDFSKVKNPVEKNLKNTIKEICTKMKI